MKRMFAVVLFGTACSEYSYTSKVQKDVFQQVRRNTVDILLVIDDSCSMKDEQVKLSNNFEAFISAFSGVNVDWQIGVTTTDTYYVESPGSLLGGDDELILEAPDGRVLNSVQWNSSWPYGEGVSMQLSGDAYSPTSNTSKGNWCLAVDSYGDGDLGSPGVRNPSCDGSEIEEEPQEPSEAEPEDFSDVKVRTNLNETVFFMTFVKRVFFISFIIIWVLPSSIIMFPIR